jgi:hypothetical protein
MHGVRPARTMVVLSISKRGGRREGSIPPATKRTPWNKGKLIGAKPPLWPKHVWSIRTKLHIEGRILELALFNLAIDSKLRGAPG